MKCISGIVQFIFNSLWLQQSQKSADPERGVEYQEIAKKKRLDEWVMKSGVWKVCQRYKVTTKTAAKLGLKALKTAGICITERAATYKNTTKQSLPQQKKTGARMVKAHKHSQGINIWRDGFGRLQVMEETITAEF